MAVLYVVIPCYNEQEVLGETTRRLVEKLTAMIREKTIDPASRILYVDDGSKDKTWEMIEAFHQKIPLVCGVKLAHNRGHQNALLAGLMAAKDHCDCAASMDADLQDDINVLDGFMEKYRQGCDIVYGVRSERKTDTGFKRLTAQGYYTFLKKLGVEIVYNHADCRLMSRRALQELSRYRETNLFLRGMVPHMGFKQDIVYFERAARFAGESKYPLKKMLGLAWQGVTSFSVKPLQLISTVGIVILFLSLFGFFTQGILALCGIPVSGLLAAVTSLWLLGSILLIALGVVGSYLGKLYEEVKARPRFAFDKILLSKSEKNTEGDPQL
ncbi:MAG: glycosyltransferase family 2 protein [Clostridia bacterium]|nr:glycosyltransferase family 2 protein [Clostridia bacterium]